MYRRYLQLNAEALMLHTQQQSAAAATVTVEASPLSTTTAAAAGIIAPSEEFAEDNMSDDSAPEEATLNPISKLKRTYKQAIRIALLAQNVLDDVAGE